MLSEQNINIERSIASRKLVYKKDWREITDQLSFIFVFLSLAATSTILIILIFNERSDFDITLLFIGSIFILIFSLYAIYRAIINDHLTSVKTQYSKDENIKHICQYLLSLNYTIKLNTNDLLIFNKKNNEGSWSERWSTDIIVFPIEKHLFFIIKKKYPITNPPVLFYHLILKKKIRLFLRTI